MTTDTANSSGIERNGKVKVEQTNVDQIESSTFESKCLSAILQRKWIVFVAAVLSQALGVAYVFSLGVLYVELIESFEVSRTQAAWIASLAVGLAQIFGVIGGVFVNVLGCRITTIIAGIVYCVGLVASFFATSIFYLYVSFGVAVGFAVSLVYSASTACVSEYFRKGRAMALALVMVGQGTGAALHPLLFQFLIDLYHWRGALLLMAGLMLNLCVFGFFMKPIETRDKQTEHRSLKDVIKSFLDVQVFKSRPYMVYVTARLMFGVGVTLMYTFMVDFMISTGYSRDTGIRMLVYYNIGNIAGRLLSCLIQVKRTVSPLDAHIVSTLSLTLTFMLYPWIKTFDGIVALSLFSGLSLGVVIGTFASIPAQLVDPKFFPTAFGLQITFQGVGIFVSPTLAAWITDATGTYRWSLIVISCCMLVGVTLFITVRLLLYRLQRQAKKARDQQTTERFGHINQVYSTEISTGAV